MLGAPVHRQRHGDVTTQSDKELELASEPQRAQFAARRKIRRGLWLTASTPIAAIVAIAGPSSPIVIASFYMAIAGGIGIGSIVIGVARLRRTANELREIEEARIPKARLLR